MDRSTIQAVDTMDMWGMVCSFPEQWQHALDLSAEMEFTYDRRRIRNICIMGMGGSAIAGDLIRGYAAPVSPIPVMVNRQYKLPAWVGENTLFIASSYSGSTEETLDAFDIAKESGAQIVCMTSGGRLLEKAIECDCDYIHIPTGLSPRAALAYFFVPLYKMFTGLELIKDDPSVCTSMPDFLREQVESFSDTDENEPLYLAETILDTLPVIYSNSGYLEAVNVRWRSQFAENAKILSYGNVLPEMNHSEIVGWEQMAHLTGRLSVFMLYDADDHEGIQSRMQVTRSLIQDHVVALNTIAARGPDRLSKMFYLVQFGDFLSLYYAYLNGTDPTPVTKIEMLKSRLMK
jgi:glucose/mannose-6-phosphate isomerase